MAADFTEERRERLENKLSGLYETYDLETRTDEKMRLKPIIDTTKRELQELGENKSITTAQPIIDRLPNVQGGFFGRQAELKLLNEAWVNGETNIIQFIAPGGTGKTKMLRFWLDQIKPEKVIAWSFYSQGSSEEKQPSASLFYSCVLEALDPSKTISDFINQPEKLGEYLADLLRQHRCLLILDGLEPLQHSSPVLQGQLKDRTLPALLKSLAINHSSICIITTRIVLPELSAHSQPNVISQDLQNLTEEDGLRLLKSLSVTGSDTALIKAVNEYGRHALALHLLGNALTNYLDGDILKRDTLDDLIGKESYTQVETHAFKVMQAYETWLKDTPELKLLYLLGLFDHPIESEVLEVLWKAKIPNLTENISTKAWKVAIYNLREKHHLLSIHQDRAGLLDCHPLIREYFGKQLNITQPQAWKQSHKKLYEYYKAQPDKLYPDTLEEMRPLFHAVTHGCAAGLHQRVITEVYYLRIERKKEFYTINKLGAYGDDLSAIACFFTMAWQKPSTKLKDIWQLRLLGYAGFCLTGLGRLNEALEPIAANVTLAVQQKNWKEASLGARNLSELQQTLGNLAKAISSAEQSVIYAGKSGKLFQLMGGHLIHAGTLHQTGQAELAYELFQAAEAFQQKRQPAIPRLYSAGGFRYCDLLLAQGKTEAVLERAEYALEIAKRNGWLLSIALDELSLGRAHLQLATKELPRNLPLSSDKQIQATKCLEQAVTNLRAAGAQDHLPQGLLARATLFRYTHAFTNARRDLQEVFNIAAPSGMRLFLADYHLEMARLLIDESKALASNSDFPKAVTNSTILEATFTLTLKEHIKQAQELITTTGYHRRDEELADLISKTTDSINPEDESRP